MGGALLHEEGVIAVAETAQALVQDLRSYITRMWNEEEVIRPELYGDRIRLVKSVPFFVEVFRQFTDSTLTSVMFILAPYWKDLSYESWRSIFRELSDNKAHIYQFVWTASELLALDVAKLAASDPDVSVFARKFASRHAQEKVVYMVDTGEFTAPGKAPWLYQGRFDAHGIDNWAIWTRLAQEGAPMIIDISSQRTN